ncbi:MAG: 4Fe-4S dicluster domain-containing protein [Deltaproteobacteria bacterium]|nr:4Fe-4S dicluster domain-containing protein [Deltaproteobacteria bacterium]
MEAIGKGSKKIIDCSAVAKGTAKPFKPGGPRVALPEWDKDRCIRCGICYLYCPNGAVYRENDGFFDVEAKSCSGCGICHRECWFGVISMVEEE